MVVRHGGIFWGEHGKGVRGKYLARFVGPQVYDVFQRIKAAFDPRERYNPGKLVTLAREPLGIAGTPFRSGPEGGDFARTRRCNGQCAVSHLRRARADVPVVQGHRPGPALAQGARGGAEALGRAPAGRHGGCRARAFGACRARRRPRLQGLRNQLPGADQHPRAEITLPHRLSHTPRPPPCRPAADRDRAVPTPDRADASAGEPAAGWRLAARGGADDRHCRRPRPVAAWVGRARPALDDGARGCARGAAGECRPARRRCAHRAVRHRGHCRHRRRTHRARLRTGGAAPAAGRQDRACEGRSDRLSCHGAEAVAPRSTRCRGACRWWASIPPSSACCGTTTAMPG